MIVLFEEGFLSPCADPSTKNGPRIAVRPLRSRSSIQYLEFSPVLRVVIPPGIGEPGAECDLWSKDQSGSGDWLGSNFDEAGFFLAIDVKADIADFVAGLPFEQHAIVVASSLEIDHRKICWRIRP